MNYFVNNLCIKNNNEISKNCFNNIKFDTNPYCSVIKNEHSSKDEKNIINILYEDTTNTKCASNTVDNCNLSPQDILDVKSFIISKLIRQNCIILI